MQKVQIIDGKRYKRCRKRIGRKGAKHTKFVNDGGKGYKGF